MSLGPPPIQDVTLISTGRFAQTWIKWFQQVQTLVNQAVSSAAVWGSITGTLSNQTDLQAALDAKQNTGNYITALSGDVTASGPGSAVATLANTAVTPGTYAYPTSATVDGKGRLTAISAGTAPAGGTVTSVSVTTANGVSGSVATATTTPAITLALGAITPSSVAASGTVTGSNLSGTNTGDQTITLTGDVTGSGTGSFVTAIGTGVIVNTDVNASAAIALTKLAATTVSRALVSDGSGFVSPATTTSTEIGYVNGVTSAIQTQLNGKQATGNYITALTGDGTASGPGSSALTFATVNANVGSFGSSTAIPNFTVNGKGLITAAGTNVVIAPAGTLTGTTLASNVVTSSLTSLGTQSADLNMGSHKLTNVTDPTSAQDAATKAYVDTAVTGLLDYRGGYNASTNLFPATGGSGLAGAILKGDFWICTVAGTLGGVAVTPGDLIIAIVDTPAQTAANWDLIAHDLGSYVTSVSGTTNRITSTGGSTPAIDISASYVGQTSITTLGTIATGTWQGTIINPSYGGTGVNNGSSTLTLAGNVTHAGAFTQSFTATGNTAVTLPNSGTLYGTATNSITSAQLATSLTDETGSGANVFAISPVLVTPALGTPSSGTLSSCTGLPIVGGTTGTLTEARGGTNQTTYAAGDILYASATNTLSKLTIGSTGQVLKVAAGLPSWGASTGSSNSFRGGRTAAQSIPNGAYTKVQINTDSFSSPASSANFDFVTNFRFTPTIAGRYSFSGSVGFNFLASGVVYGLGIYKNGSIFTQTLGSSSPTGNYDIKINDLIQANGSTDFFELFVFQASGGALNTLAGATDIYFAGFLTP